MASPSGGRHRPVVARASSIEGMGIRGDDVRPGDGFHRGICDRGRSAGMGDAAGPPGVADGLLPDQAREPPPGRDATGRRTLRRIRGDEPPPGDRILPAAVWCFSGSASAVGDDQLGVIISAGHSGEPDGLHEIGGHELNRYWERVRPAAMSPTSAARTSMLRGPSSGLSLSVPRSERMTVVSFVTLSGIGTGKTTDCAITCPPPSKSSSTALCWRVSVADTMVLSSSSAGSSKVQTPWFVPTPTNPHTDRCREQQIRRYCSTRPFRSRPPRA